MTDSEFDAGTMKVIRDYESFSVSDLLKSCEVRNDLLKDDDGLIARFTAQLSEYEQELYEKDVYIKELEVVVRQILQAGHHKGDIP